MNDFTKWIIDNLDKLSLKCVTTLRTFFHRFFDDGHVLSAVLGHTEKWVNDNGQSDRLAQYLIKNKDSLNKFGTLIDGANNALKDPTPEEKEAK